MRRIQSERMNKINELIKVIANTDRRFFYHNKKDSIDKFIEGKTTVFFFDDFLNKKISLTYSNRNRFSHGGTLWGLVNDFKEWIITGKYSNGHNGYGGLYCSHWGYSNDGMKKIIEKAKEIGYLK
ncbi:hypothetical protein [Clostridium botulinum]|uniref:hypothetical protein n=1 Tax=Clostridium botulinum TaxID=1491 RepID=UPI001C9B9077|nr:hypothetical protein [Clostridium botulinum]MBY6838676.1 hypothetical protein [Clostridium botulinum]